MNLWEALKALVLTLAIFVILFALWGLLPSALFALDHRFHFLK